MLCFLYVTDKALRCLHVSDSNLQSVWVCNWNQSTNSGFTYYVAACAKFFLKQNTKLFMFRDVCAKKTGWIVYAKRYAFDLLAATTAECMFLIWFKDTFKFWFDTGLYVSLDWHRSSALVLDGAFLLFLGLFLWVFVTLVFGWALTLLHSLVFWGCLPMANNHYGFVWWLPINCSLCFLGIVPSCRLSFNV